MKLREGSFTAPRQHPAQPHPDPGNINQENMLGRGKNMLEAEMMMFLWVEVVQYYDIGV